MNLKQHLINLFDTIKGYENETGFNIGSFDSPTEIFINSYMEANGLNKMKSCKIYTHISGCSIEIDGRYIFIDSREEAEYFAELYTSLGYDVTVISA